MATNQQCTNMVVLYIFLHISVVYSLIIPANLTRSNPGSQMACGSKSNTYDLSSCSKFSLNMYRLVEHTFDAQRITFNVDVDDETGSTGVRYIDEYLNLYPKFPPDMKVPDGSVQSQFTLDHKIMLVYDSGESTDPCLYSDAEKVLKILRDQLQNDPDIRGGLLHAIAFLGQRKTIEFFVCNSENSLWDAEHVEPFAIEDGHYYANDVLSSTDCAAVFFQAARWAATFEPRATLPKNMDESFASSTIALRFQLREDWNEGKVTWPTYGHLRDLMRNLPGQMPGATLQSWRGTTGEISIRREGSSLYHADYVPKGYLQLSRGIAPPRTSVAANLTATSRGGNLTETSSSLRLPNDGSGTQ